MNYLNIPLFFFLMFSGIMITINASSWFGAWLGMELNIIGFLPLMLDSKNSLSFEMIMKYFLISSISSLIILMLSCSKYSIWNFSMFNYNSFIVTLALMIKLGAVPFHYWFINLVGNLKPNLSFFLMSFQKMAPLFLLNMSLSTNLIFMFLVMSSIFGSLGGFYQFSSMKLMAYSSISHLSWMFTCIIFFNKFWFLYFCVYTLMLIPILKFIWDFSVYHINMIMDVLSNSKFWFCISILSFAGFPPFLGFFPKLFIIYNMFYMKLFFISMILIFMSMFNLYFYIRMIYNYISMFSFSSPIMNNYNTNIMNILSFLPCVSILML